MVNEWKPCPYCKTMIECIYKEIRATWQKIIHVYVETFDGHSYVIPYGSSKIIQFIDLINPWNFFFGSGSAFGIRGYLLSGLVNAGWISWANYEKKTEILIIKGKYWKKHKNWYFYEGKFEFTEK